MSKAKKCEHDWCLAEPRMGVMRYKCSKCSAEAIGDE